MDIEADEKAGQTVDPWRDMQVSAIATDDVESIDNSTAFALDLRWLRPPAFFDLDSIAFRETRRLPLVEEGSAESLAAGWVVRSAK